MRRFDLKMVRTMPLVILFMVLVAWPVVTQAEIRVVAAQGEHRMGDRDTREDALHLATEAAKRNALEQVAVFLESITIVDGLVVTKDEIRTYTAGLVLVLDQVINTTLDGNTVVIKTDLVAQIDTEEVRQAIATLRENKDAWHQLVALQQENDQLQRELAAANQALAQASTTDQTRLAAQQRQSILNRVQSNAMVSQAWTDWLLLSPGIYSSSQMGLAHIQTLLATAQGLYSTSPHVHAAQQVTTTRQPSVPPQPPVPPEPGAGPATMPRHQITPVPGSQTVRQTLNEITYRTPTGQPYTSHQPVNQIPPSTGISPMTNQIAPAMKQIQPQTLRQIPQMPSQIAPHRFGGGGGRER